MEINNNKKLFRFEAFPAAGAPPAYLEYRWLKGSMVLMHTIVPPAFRGSGIGSALVKYVLEYARAQNLKIIIYCPFVEQYVKDHPQYADLKN